MSRERVSEILIGKKCQNCPGIECFNAGLLFRRFSLAKKDEREVFLGHTSIIREPMILPMNIDQCKKTLTIDPRINSEFLKNLWNFRQEGPGFSWKKLFNL